MKLKESLRELRTLSAADLRERATKVAEEHMKLRFRQATGQVEQPHRLSTLRKDQARIQTLLSEKHLAHKAS